MYNEMMMDPEMIRIAQEHMSKISPQELARIQQQMFSNPELMKLATESMKNMRPEDIKMAAEQLKHARPEDMAEIGEKIATASPDEIAAMRARAEAQALYELNAAETLKKQGNELHNHGKFREAAEKYLLAKNNLKGMQPSKCRTLQTQCSLNLMSCYLKTSQFDECIEEGSQVLVYDPTNVKALYRRGQAYKELGRLEAAVADLQKAHEASPDDETVAASWRDASEKLVKEGPDRNKPRGIIIEEIVEDDAQSMTSEGSNVSSSAEHVVSPTPEVGNQPSSSNVQENGYRRPISNNEYLRKLKDDPESIRSFQEYIANVSPESMTALGGTGMPPEMMKTATNMIKNMKPDELQKMLQVASSMNMNNNINPMATNNQTNGSGMSSHFPEMTPEMISMASEKLSKMSPEELQRMVEAASSLNLNNSPFSAATSEMRNRGSKMAQQSSTTNNRFNEDVRRENTSTDDSESTVGPSLSSHPTSTADLPEAMRNPLRDPAMRQMFSSMIKSMSPETMANMSQQFGVKLSKEDAAKAQQAMSSLSPDDLERMMRWAERAQKGVETARRTKNWLLGRPGMILSICMLILAAILHRMGYIGS